MQMSQQPKIGPLSGLQAIANWARFRVNFSLMSIEKMKEPIDLSAAQCFLVEFQARGVQPPMTLPYSVSRMVMVSVTLSHRLWNSATEKAFQLALQSRFMDLAEGFEKSERMQSCSLVTLLLKPGIQLEKTDTLVESDILFFLPSVMQRSLMRSSWKSRFLSAFWHSSWQKLVQHEFSSFMKRVERIWFMQTPEMLLQFCQLTRLMKFMVSWLKPKRLIHFLKLRCSSLIFLISEENRFSISSCRMNISGILVLGFQQMMFSSSAHCIFSHLSWNRAHSLLVVMPCSQMKAGLRQFAFTQIMKHLLPQMQSGQFLIGLLISKNSIEIDQKSGHKHPNYAIDETSRKVVTENKKEIILTSFLLIYLSKGQVALFYNYCMNPENMGHHLTMKHSSLWRKPLNYEKTGKRVNTCHGQLNEVAYGGVCWKLRNNAIQTRSDFKAKTRIIRQDCSKQLKQTLKEGKKGSRRTQSMLQTLKTEASWIDKTPKLVTGMKSLKQMILLASRDLNTMRYCIRKNPTITNHHERKSTSGFGRSACGRFYTS